MRYIFSLLALLYALSSHAQMINYDSVVAPLEVAALDFPEYLVQLAWINRPDNMALQKEADIARLQASMTNKEWMRDLGLSFNINEVNIEGRGENGNLFFPRWNIGIIVNPYNIMTQSSKNKMAIRQVDIAELALKERMLEVRRLTLVAYENFKGARESIGFRAMFEQDAYNNLVLVKELYQRDKTTFQDYSAANQSYFNAQEMRKNAEQESRLAQYELESVIGIRWENVQHPLKNPG
jgi:outer membrane protein TolC